MWREGGSGGSNFFYPNQKFLPEIKIFIPTQNIGWWMWKEGGGCGREGGGCGGRVVDVEGKWWMHYIIGGRVVDVEWMWREGVRCEREVSLGVVDITV